MSGNAISNTSRLGDRIEARSPQAQSEDAEDHGAFGQLRGVRDRAVTLELRMKDGGSEGIPYGFIERFRFHPSEGIILYCGGQEIRIIGRNLNKEVRQHVRLYRGMLRHRVSWIQEMDDTAKMKANEGDVVIDAIKFD